MTTAYVLEMYLTRKGFSDVTLEHQDGHWVIMADWQSARLIVGIGRSPMQARLDGIHYLRGWSLC